MKKIVYIASDHAGFELKNKITNYYLNVEWIDLGCFNTDRVDYPDYAKKLSLELLEKPEAVGILICGSGQGMAMTANKFEHIRAALCWDIESAKLSRAHNNANILCLGERLIDNEYAIQIVKAFLDTDFESGRHEERVKKIKIK